jgi:hypothetical protein
MLQEVTLPFRLSLSPETAVSLAGIIDLWEKHCYQGNYLFYCPKFYLFQVGRTTDFAKLECRLGKSDWQNPAIEEPQSGEFDKWMPGVVALRLA